MNFVQDGPRHAYSEAIRQLGAEYEQALTSGRYRSASFPWTFLNVFLLITGLYVASTSQSQDTFLVRSIFFTAIVLASTWSVLQYRSPGVVGSLGVGLNAFMITIFATNLLVLRDPRHVKRASLLSIPNEKDSGSDDTSKHHERCSWVFEPSPTTRRARLIWILDLLACLRAAKWSWNSPHPSKSQLLTIDTKLRTFKYHLIGFSCSYIGLDVTKCIMISDSHFLGDIACAAPAHLSHLSPLVLHTYRMLVPAVGITFAIKFFFSAWTLFQMKLLGPRVLGINGQEFMFPPIYGSVKAVATHGLRGFWGQTWHQIFRAHFSSIVNAVANAVVAEGSKTARTAVRVSAAFALSGLFHACGSYTLLGATRPFNAFAFFALQPVGIAMQVLASRLFFRNGQDDPEPCTLHMVANVAFTISWLWATFWLLADDFSRGGMWLFEPVPVSFVRGLGFSAEDTRWLPHFGTPIPRETVL